MKDYLCSLFSISAMNSTSEKGIDSPDKRTPESIGTSSIFHTSTSESLRETYNIITNKPNGTQCAEICKDEKRFQLLEPTDWITAAKHQPILFKIILENHPLAKWVNGFPESDPQGLTMIATYSNKHLEVAANYLQCKKPEIEPFSEAQVQMIYNAIKVQKISIKVSSTQLN